MHDAVFADVPYDTVFDEKVLAFLRTQEAQGVIVKRYNELLASSTYFKKGTFDYYNAGQITKSLASNGFFAAKHTVTLNAEKAAEASGGGFNAGQRSDEDGDRKKRVELVGARQDVAFTMEKFAVSERRACELNDVDRSSYRYEPRLDRKTELRDKLIELARQKPRFGYRRLGVLLEKNGVAVNHKRLFRVYQEAGLGVRRRETKRLERSRVGMPLLSRPNQEWSPFRF